MPLAVPSALHALINRADLEEVTAAIFKMYGCQVRTRLSCAAHHGRRRWGHY